MTLWESCGWTLGRAILVAIAAWPICRLLETSLRTSATRVQKPVLAILAVLFLFPELLTAFAWMPWVAGRPAVAEVGCAVLLWCRAIPIGVAALLVGPPTAESGPSRFLSQELARESPIRGQYRWRRFRGELRRVAPALVLMGLVTFQEFELAALFKTVSWTDWLFVAQARGLELGAAARQVVLPVAIQLVALFVLVWSSRANSASEPDVDPGEQSRWRLAGGVVLIPLFLLVLLPLVLLAPAVVEGLSVWWQQPGRLRGMSLEMVSGLSASLVASMGALWVAGRLLDGLGSTWGRFWLIAGLLPGLCGALALAMALQGLFLLPGLQTVYGTPLPWVIGLTLWLLPRAALLQWWTRRSLEQPAVVVAEQLPDGGRRDRVLWRMRDRPRFLAGACLVYWGYLDLTLASMLAPAAMTPGIVRLYNFMHYGRSTMLSVEAITILLVPVAIAGLVLGCLSLRRG